MAHANYSGFGTRAIHVGVDPDPTSGAVITPISLSTTFQQTSPGVHKGFDYSRSGNPTRAAFEKNIATAENAAFGLAFASGLAATTTVTHLLRAGDHVVCMDDVYGGTRRYFSRIASRAGLNFTYTDFSRPGELDAAITAQTKLVWLESPTNPLLKITDIKAVASVAKKHNLIFVVDNTFMSPYFQNPLDLGADIVVHSVTKYISGHSDIVMGVVATNRKDLFDDLKFLQNGIGAVPSAFDCFLALRSMKTLHVRMREHERSATKIATFLSQHPQVERVIYPGLQSHPQHELAKQQMKGFGGMITFFLKGGISESRKFLENIKIPALAESLGGVESLIELPSVMTHASVPSEERAKLGISDSLIRLSVGLEDVDDLIADLTRALQTIAP
jgi:cystathionine gamma-lyase